MLKNSSGFPLVRALESVLLTIYKIQNDKVPSHLKMFLIKPEAICSKENCKCKCKVSIEKRAVRAMCMVRCGKTCTKRFRELGILTALYIYSFIKQYNHLPVSLRNAALTLNPLKIELKDSFYN